MPQQTRRGRGIEHHRHLLRRHLAGPETARTLVSLQMPVSTASGHVMWTFIRTPDASNQATDTVNTATDPQRFERAIGLLIAARKLSIDFELDFGRVDFVVDRSPRAERFAGRVTRDLVWRPLSTGAVHGLGISRPETYYYTLYLLEPATAWGSLTGPSRLALHD